jgi:prolyl oligopeptidase
VDIIRFHITSLLAICTLFSAFVALTLAQTSPPKAEVRIVTDDYFGVKIVDPYRWMEDLKADSTQKWLKEQADYAKAYLERLPMRNEILQELSSLRDSGVRIGVVRPRGNLFFITKRNPNEPDFKLYVREGISGVERLLIDPSKIIDGGKRYSLGGWNVSWDGKYVSYVISASGSEDGQIRVVEVATGKDMGERISRARFGAGVWLPDGKSFLHIRIQQLPEGASDDETYQKSRIFKHILGTSPDTDKPIFGFEVNPNISLDAKMIPSINTNPHWKYVIATLNSGTASNNEIYVAPVDSLNQQQIPWRKVVSLNDEISDYDLHGDDLYLVTYKNAPRYKIIRTSLSKPNLSKAKTFFSAGEGIILNKIAQRDALYVQMREGGNRKLYRVDYKTQKAELLKLPFDGSASIALSEFGDGIYFNATSWTKSTAHFRYDPKTKDSKNTNLVPPLPVDMSGVEFVNAKAKSHDGVMVPLVIIHKKGLKRDGTNPVLMSGYGAYGNEHTPARFAPRLLPWINRGGIIVFTGVRGGGEYGEEWHSAGKLKNKPNTWKDFIACAEYLITEKYTSPEHLGIQGGSAGGILISNAIATRPDLFGAAIINVGFVNVLRGVKHYDLAEFGSTKTAEDFNSLLAMDGYLKIKDGVKYPAVLLTHGINDPRVEPWMSAKLAARLQAASNSNKPVLLRIDYDAGHGVGSTIKQQNEQQADEYVFLFQQLGIEKPR